MTHSNPNTAQVPATHSLYGEACRACFFVPGGFRLVGCDAEGLELRMLGHYMARFDGGAYAHTVVNGRKEDGTDVHTVNQRLIGLRSRDSAKTWIYAYLYGAGNLKLGSVVYDDMSDERRAAFNDKYPAGEAREKALARLGLKGRRRIEEGLPALGQLQALVKAKARRGFVLTLDGGKLQVRSQHAALNTLLQGAGAVVMKKALVILYDACLALGWKHGVEFAFVANVHDEFQAEVREDLAEQFGKLASDAIRLAGEAFGLKCPLAGAYAIGSNWAETH
jgi:DNA polymerase I-like protein with 3'-5' exonuclease and polymerase domains